MMALRNITNLKHEMAAKINKPTPLPSKSRKPKPTNVRKRPQLSPNSKLRRAALDKFDEPKDPARRLNWVHLESALREAIVGQDDSAYKTTNIKVLANKIERNIAHFCNYDQNKRLYENQVETRLDIIRHANRKLIVKIMTHKLKPWDFARLVYQKNIVSESTIKNFDQGQPLTTKLWPTREIARKEMAQQMAEMSLNGQSSGKRKRGIQPVVEVNDKVNKTRVTPLLTCSKCGEVEHENFITNYFQCLTCKKVIRVDFSEKP